MTMAVRSLIRILVLLLSALFFVHALPKQEFIVPSYIYPTDAAWNELVGIKGYVIINPNSGPGTKIDSNYVAATKKEQDSGTLVLGYVHTSWAARDQSIVKQEVDEYYEWYKVNGIFFDEASTSNTSYYKSLYSYVKSYNTTNNYNMVIINPGTPPDEAFKNGCADVIVAAEMLMPTYVSQFNPGWTNETGLNVKIAHIVEDTPSSDYEKIVDLSRSYNADYIYVTDKSYSALPSYWEDEVKYVDKESR